MSFIVKKITYKIKESKIPDADSDFGTNPISGFNKDTIIDYLIKKYGPNHVASVGNKNYYSAKSAIRDLGNVYGIPPSESFACTKEYNTEQNVKMNMKRNSNIDAYFKLYPVLQDKVDKLVGTLSNVSVHAGGIVITDIQYPLNKYCALQRSSDTSRIATLWDKNELQLVGLIKYDILGLSSASMIHYTKKLVGLDPYQDSSEENEVFENINNNCKNKNIFQFETGLGAKAITDLKPMSIMEIANASGIIRGLSSEEGRHIYQTYKENVEQSRIGNIDYWKRKIKEQVSDDIYEICIDILKDSYGVLIYQEQVSDLCAKISKGKLTFTDGNELRKLLDEHGNKFGPLDACQGNRELVQSWHKEFMIIIEKYLLPYLDKDGWNSNNKDLIGFLKCDFDANWRIPQPKIGIISWMISATAYLFSKLHAIAYSVNTYNMMYLKYHYPREFWYSALSIEYGNLDKVKNYFSAIRIETPHVIILSPDINMSEFNFSMEGENSIRIGLGILKNLGKSADDIIKERKNGQYKSIEDFNRRMKGIRSVNKRTIQNLIYAGGFSSFGSLTDVWKKFKDLGRALDDIELNHDELSSIECDIIGTNIIFIHPILSRAHDYFPIDEINDDSSEIVAIRILSTVNKTTKNGKPYKFLKVQCLNSYNIVYLFDWDNKKWKENEYLTARVSKKAGFYSIKKPDKNVDSKNIDTKESKKINKRVLRDALKK